MRPPAARPVRPEAAAIGTAHAASRRSIGLVHLREHVRAVRSERQILDPLRGGHGQLRVEVRKQRAAPRDLPLQLRARRVRVDRDDQEVALTLEVLRGGLADLRRGREVDVAVLEVDGCARERSGVPGGGISFASGWRSASIVSSAADS